MRCPSCQTENDPASSTCEGCGLSLEPTWAAPAEDFRPGTLFDSRYEIIGLLGRGGMGVVYRARDRMLDENVAIKVLSPEFAREQTMVKRFKSEIKLARKVRHRNVCTIHDYGEERGLLYISMELVEGDDLKRVLKRDGAFPVDEAYEMAIQVAEGLQAVHEAGIIHRDLKSSNIIRDAEGVARLMDFGVAKRLDAGDTSSGSSVTATGQIIGTPDYMSPEQAQGQKIDFRSDIYALGVVIYEIFTGHVPFHGDTPISTILKHIHDPPPLDEATSHRIPPELKPVIRRAMAKNPADRYASAREVADAIARACTRSVPDATLLDPDVPSTTKARLPPERRPASRRLGLLIGISSLGLLGAAMWAYFSFPSPASLDHAPIERGTPPTTVAPTSSPASTVAISTTAPTTTSSAPPTSVATTSLASPPVRQSTSTTSMPPTTTVPPSTSTSSPEPRVSDPLGPGTLQVAVVPWAEVRVDGEVIGTTPLDKITLSAGAHSLEIRHPSYEPIVREVVIETGENEKILVNLPRQGVPKR